MADIYVKLSELSRPSTPVNDSDVVFISQLNNAENISSAMSISDLRDLLNFETAFETTTAGLAATTANQIFYVYTDGQKLAVNPYYNRNGVAEAIVDSNSNKLVYSTLAFLQQWFTYYGYSLIKEVTSFASLRTLPVLVEGQKVKLRSYYDGGNSGGGEFVGHKGTATDDGGIIAAGNGYYWERVFDKGVVHAQYFGIVENRAVGQEVINAITYLNKNGGELRFPTGVFNLGTTRFKFPFTTGYGIKIVGSGNRATKFIFENVDPLPMANPSTDNWTKEETLFIFGTTPSASMNVYSVPVEITNIHFDYSNQVNKGGNTYETMGVGAHPTPYSTGSSFIDFIGVDKPIIQNCKFTNMYGNGVRIQYCKDAIIRDSDFFDCSGNQVRGRYNFGESLDSTGSGIFSWASQDTLIENCVAYNTRVYKCDPQLTASNGAVYNGSICGYIGIYGEYSINVNGDDKIPIRTNWQYINNTDGIKTTTATIKDCEVSGYVLGIKSEANIIITIDGNKVHNCYIPVSCQSSGHISNNYIDNTDISLFVSPQVGFESQRGSVCLSWWSGDTIANVASHQQYVVNNTIIGKKYACIVTGKASSFISHNTLISRENGKIIDTLTSWGNNQVVMESNTIVIDSPSKDNNLIRPSNTKLFIFAKNTLINTSTFRVQIGLSEGTKQSVVSENFFRGRIYFYISNGDVTIEKNRFILDPTTGLGPSAQIYNTSRVQLVNNYFEIANSFGTNNFMISTSTDVKFNNNVFQIINDAALTSNVPLVTTYSYNKKIEFIGNRIVGDNNGSFGHLLFQGAGTEILRFDNNISDGPAPLLKATSGGKGPWFISNNQASAQNDVGAEKNTSTNLSSDYIASIGTKIPYLLPAQSGKEGIIYTANGWVVYGSIG
nr:MAG TPA: tailspike protein [Bacteriophage sp.]